MQLEGFTPEERAIIQWQYGFYGSFYKALFEAICLADDSNIEKIAKGFPVEVSAYKRYKQESGWRENVEKKMNALKQ